MDHSRVLDQLDVFPGKAGGRGEYPKLCRQTAVTCPGSEDGPDVDVGERQNVAVGVDTYRNVDGEDLVSERGTLLDVLDEQPRSSVDVDGHSRHRNRAQAARGRDRRG